MEEVQRAQALEPSGLGAEEADSTIWSRRDFFSLAGWGGILAFFAYLGVASLRFMFPRVLFEPSPVFKAGRPDIYQPGAVDERFKQSQRTWIVRNADGSFYAMLAICTHLGCTPNWLKSDDKFKCPCHGSGFKFDGTNFEGPAPRPLDRVKIMRTPEGELIVDKSVVYTMKPGVDPDEQYPQSILRV
ncbi:MAG: ubiquinol-cytochrome c reductase iron-sulfur subunit [Candidatus Methylomirabilales bacterium]